MTAVDAFIDHALTTRFSDLPAPAIASARTFIADSLAVGVAGARAPGVDSVRRAAKTMGGVGGPVAVWGADSFSTTSHAATFANAFQIHCQEYDCVHEAAVVHPMATIFSALMAESQARGPVSGEDLITAVAVAVNVATGLGVACSTPLKFFRPATAGLFGATLGLARLRGFSREQARDAMGLALGHASGTMQAHLEGTPALPMQIANASRSAHMACDLAEGGLKGPHDVLEGPYGYLTLMEDAWDLGPVLADLGKVWRINEVSHKPFPTGRAAQGGIVLVKALRARGVSADALERLELSAPPIITQLVARRPQPDMSVAYARLCFAYCGARALISGHVGLEDFTPDTLTDAATLGLADKVFVTLNHVQEASAFTPQVATARLSDGRTVDARIDALYGSVADPMDVDAQHDKIKRCVAFGFDRPNPGVADAIIQCLTDLERVADVASLARIASGQEETSP